MEWQGEAIVLGTRKHGESNCILEVMTKENGRHLGLVRGGASRKKLPILQPGNIVSLTWRARLSEHLGHFVVEPVKSNTAVLMEKSMGILGIQTIANLLRLLPERDPHPHLYDVLAVLIGYLTEPEVAGAAMVRFELEILQELGLGLDLTKCAATGADQDLVWVSPKSGRAVSKDAGEPYADRLLPLPEFLIREWHEAAPINLNRKNLEQAFNLSGYFLAHRVFEPRGIEFPEVRSRFMNELLDSFAQKD